MVEELPAGNKLVGFYRGQVLKHCVQGKCKLWIPGVYPIEWRSSPLLIPDAEQAAPLFGGSAAGNGMFSWPDVGSIVWCFFQNGDQNMPVYFAAATGGPDAYDQYATCSNADTVFLQEGQSEFISACNETSRVHRINSGCSNMTLFENGCISARTSFPIESTSGTLGANCSYGEYLAHFYADKGLWSYSDIVPVEDKTLRLGIAVSKAGSASSFLASFQADADAVPPAIDVFFYVHKTGAGAAASIDQEDEEELPPSQVSSDQQDLSAVQRNGIYFCTVGLARDQQKFSYTDTAELLDQQLKFASKNNYELFVCQGDLIADIGSFMESGTSYIAQNQSAKTSSGASSGASSAGSGSGSAGGGGSGGSSSGSLLDDVSGATKSTSSAAGTVSGAASNVNSAAGSLNSITNSSLGGGASSISNATGQINSIAGQTSSAANNISNASKDLDKITSGNLSDIPSSVTGVTNSINGLTGGKLGGSAGQINSTVGLATSVSKDVDTVTSAIKDVAPGVTDTLGEYGQSLKGLGTDAVDGLKDMTSGITDSITDTASGMVDSIKETTSGMVDSVKDTVSDITDGIKDIGSSASEATTGMTDKVTSQKTDDFSSIAKKLFNVLKKIAKVLVKYVSGSAAAVMMQVNAAVSSVTQIVGMMKKFFNRAKELLDWNKDNVQKVKDGLDKDSEDAKKIQEEQKQKVQQKTQQLAAQYGISILAVYPKHVYSDIVMSNDGIISAGIYNNFTQQKTNLDIDADGKFQICTSHILSDDMSLPDKDTLGKSYGLMTMDSTGNACINGIYQTPKEEVSCIFDMTTRECIRLELTKSNLIPSTDEHKDDLVCACVCDTSQGTVDLSAAYYDNLTQKNNYSVVRLTKNGELYINGTTALDVFVMPDIGGMMSHLNMTKDGVVTIDSTQSINIQSPYISMVGDKIDVLAGIISAQSTQLEANVGTARIENGSAEVTSSSITTDSESIETKAESIETKASSMQVDSNSMFINGMVGDCNIQRISLTRHVHPCPDGTTGTPLPS